MEPFSTFYQTPDIDVLWPLSGPSLRAQMQQLVVAERSEPGPRLGEAGPSLVMRGRWADNLMVGEMGGSCSHGGGDAILVVKTVWCLLSR